MKQMTEHKKKEKKKNRKTYVCLGKNKSHKLISSCEKILSTLWSGTKGKQRALDVQQPLQKFLTEAAQDKDHLKVNTKHTCTHSMGLPSMGSPHIGLATPKDALVLGYEWRTAQHNSKRQE